MKNHFFDFILSDYSDSLCYNHKQMPSKNTEKKSDSIRELGRNISPILVINNSSLKPYIELFNHEPENIYQKPLGNLLGFFEIKEYSEQSAYIVNFLTSVLKKEYYANPRRSVTESFDSALHKVNLALSEVTKHGNIEWIGKLHASICVIEKNSIHFTVAGNAKIFLKRKETLTDISEGLSSDENEPHPLKTFINVSSGRIEKEDKLIITSEDIFHILKLSDLKKSFGRLSKEQFVQFLKTALSNELEMIATIVVDFEETKKTPAIKKLTAPEDADFQQEAINVFSQTAFMEKKSDVASEKIPDQVEENPTQTDYTDKKTGHIYVQGSALPEEIGQLQYYWEMTIEKISDGWHFSKNAFKRNYNLQKKRLGKKIRQAQKNVQLRKERFETERKLELERLEQAAHRQQTENAQAQSESAEKIPAQQPASTVVPKRRLTEIINLKEKKAVEKKKLPLEREPEQELAEKNEIPKIESLRPGHIQEIQIVKDGNSYFEKLRPFLERTEKTAKVIFKTFKKFGVFLFQKIVQLLKKTDLKNLQVIPHLSKLKKLYQKLTPKQKMNVFLSLIIIFVVPIFIANWLNKPKPTSIKDLSDVTVQTPSVSDLATDKNPNSKSEASNLLSDNNLTKVLLAEGKIIVSTKKSLFVLQNGQAKEYPLPSEAGNILNSAYMSDIATVLALTDQNKIWSFTPSNAKFAENKIEFSNASSLSLIGTYLTYLYILDPTSNQIFRYPRAEGGFGEKTNWLKETASLSGTSDLAIDDSVYLVKDNQVEKFMKGKRQNFSLENSSPSAHFDKIFTAIDLNYLYVLDSENSQIAQYDKTSGALVAKFANNALKNAISFAVDEKNKTAYVTTSSGLVSVTLQ